jgi:hypothetical protein
MHTDAAPEIVVPDGQGVHVVKLFQRGANNQSPVYLSGSHGFANLRQLVFELWVNEVAMGVGEHGVEVSKRKKNSVAQRVLAGN